MCTRSALRWASVHLLLTTAALPLVIIRRVIYFFLLLLYTLVCNPCEKYRAGTHESAVALAVLLHCCRSTDTHIDRDLEFQLALLVGEKVALMSW